MDDSREVSGEMHSSEKIVGRWLRARGARDRITLCLLYTSDAADERSSVDLGGRRIIKKKTSGLNGGAAEWSYTEGCVEETSGIYTL